MDRTRKISAPMRLAGQSVKSAGGHLSLSPCVIHGDSRGERAKSKETCSWGDGMRHTSPRLKHLPTPQPL